MKEKGKSREGGSGPCAACRLLRRKCVKECAFAPYFPAKESHNFAIVHKVFGASNVNKMLQELPENHRSDAVSAMVYEASARVRDPIYGCVGAISSLQRHVDALHSQLALARAELLHLRMLLHHHRRLPPPPPPTSPATKHISGDCFPVDSESLWSSLHWD